MLNITQAVYDLPEDSMKYDIFIIKYCYSWGAKTAIYIGLSFKFQTY